MAEVRDYYELVDALEATDRSSNPCFLAADERRVDVAGPGDWLRCWVKAPSQPNTSIQVKVQWQVRSTDLRALETAQDFHKAMGALISCVAVIDRAVEPLR